MLLSLVVPVLCRVSSGTIWSLRYAVILVIGAIGPKQDLKLCSKLLLLKSNSTHVIRLGSSGGLDIGRHFINLYRMKHMCIFIV